MRKLRLHLQDLSVETFDATPAARGKGTVVGEECTYYHCTCPGNPSCLGTCHGTCDWDPTCADTCEMTCDNVTCITCEGDTCVNCPTAEFTCGCP